MRDWPEPDQDTLLDIIETWDIGDYEEAQAERAEIEYYEEKVKTEEAEVNAYYEDHPYADWTPNTCPCGATGLSPSSLYCQSCSQSMEYDALGAQYDNEYVQRQKIVDKHRDESHIAKLNADTARARADILQAQANIARITANIALLKSKIVNINYYIDDITYEGFIGVEEHYYAACNELADAENQLADAEINLVEAESVLADARTIGAAQAAVVAAQNYVKYAEAKVQIKEDAKNRAIEFVETFNSKFLDDEEDATVKGEHIEFVNALIELAEAKDALDLAEILLAKTPSLSLIRGYGFASHEPRCPTSDIAE